jgi:uncharacterized protein (DUF39 family)
LGIPIPILDEEMAAFTAVRDEEIAAPIVDYSQDYPQATGRTLGQVTYAELKSGTIKLRGREVPTASLSSYSRAVEIAEILKSWILDKRFLLGEPQWLLPPGGKKRQAKAS